MNKVNVKMAAKELKDLFNLVCRKLEGFDRLVFLVMVRARNE